MDATIGADYKRLSWIAYYDNDCKVYMLENNRVGWYPKKPRRQAPRELLRYSKTYDYLDYVTYNRYGY